MSSPWLHQLLRTIIGTVISAMIDGNFIRTGVGCLETERSYTAIDATAPVGLKSQTTGVRSRKTGTNYAMTDWIIVPGGIGNKCSLRFA